MKLSLILFCILLYICLSNFSFCSNNTIEKYQQTSYKKCVPQDIKDKIRLVLYTSSRCPHCVNAKVEWQKYKDHIKKNCKYSRFIELEHKEDKEIDDPEVQYIPTVKLYMSEKVVTFEKNVEAGELEKFVLDHIKNDDDKDKGKFYTDCDKGKMFGKFHTLCDNEHQEWNAS